jgi:hypothetical protein
VTGESRSDVLAQADKKDLRSRQKGNARHCKLRDDELPGIPERLKKIDTPYQSNRADKATNAL